MTNKKQQKNKQQQKKSAQKFLKGFGSQITRKEVKRYEQKFPDGKLKNVVKYAKKTKDVKLNRNARKYLKKKKALGPGGLSKDGGVDRPGDDGTGIFGIMQGAQESLANIIGGYDVQTAQIGADATTKSASIRGEADKYVADAYAGAQRYGSDRDLEGTKYSADKESEWRQAVAGIEVKGRLDLQPIINAGLEKVSNIEAQASRDVADITGKYGVEGIKTRGEFDEKIGKINLAGGMYGLISSAFG
jgi:hypothetical protein